MLESDCGGSGQLVSPAYYSARMLPTAAAVSTATVHKNHLSAAQLEADCCRRNTPCADWICDSASMLLGLLGQIEADGTERAPPQELRGFVFIKR